MSDYGDIEFPTEIASFVTKPGQVRKVKAGNLVFDDRTPFCVFPNPIFRFANSPIDLRSYFEDLIRKEGNVTKRDPRYAAVTKYYRDHPHPITKVADSQLSYHYHAMPETTFAMLLPLKADGNKTGQDFILEGTEVWKKFFRTLAKLRQRRAKNETETAHAAWFNVNYSLYPPSALEIQDTESFRCELTKDEQRVLSSFANDMETYWSFFERNMINMFESKPSDFQMNLKPLKSPGTDRDYPDGKAFLKKDATFYPSPLFDLTGCGAFDPLNAYCKQSFFPLKKELQFVIVPRMRLRLKGLRRNKRQDPKWEWEMTQLRAARENVIAWRINNPDVLGFVVKFDKNKPIWDVTLEPLTPTTEFHNWDDDEWWSRVQSKAREMVARIGDDYHVAFVSPYQVVCIYQQKLKDWVQRGHFTLKDGKKVVRTIFKKDGSSLRARIIMPGFWSLNMFDGTIIKFVAKPLEHCRRGFPSLKSDSGFYTYIMNRLSEGHPVQMGWATDISHFETFAASNENLIAATFGTNKRRIEYGLDAASGWNATSNGREFHGPQTSSGIADTTWHALSIGLFVTGLKEAHLAHDMSVAERHWRILLAEAIEFAKAEYNLSDPNPFSAYVNTHLTYNLMGKGGKEMETIANAGSDDQGGYHFSDYCTREEIQSAYSTPELDDFFRRFHISYDFNEEQHFSIIRKEKAIVADPTAAEWKIALMEHKSIGDLVAAGMYVVLDEAERQGTGFSEDFQTALDVIGGGDWHSYEKGYKASLCVCRNAPAFASEVLAGRYPEESPSGQVMSEKMAAAGFEFGKAMKVDEDVTRDIIHEFLDYMYRSDYEHV